MVLPGGVAPDALDGLSGGHSHQGLPARAEIVQGVVHLPAGHVGDLDHLIEYNFNAIAVELCSNASCP